MVVSWQAEASSEVANTLLQSIIRVKSVQISLSRSFGPSAYLDELVPRGRDNDRVLGVGAEADAGNPLGVALVCDGELAVTEGVPQLDGAVSGSGDDLTVVGGEGDGENIVGVADEAAGGGARGKLPEAESLVPRGGQSVGTVGGDHLSRSPVSPSILLNHTPRIPASSFGDRMFNVHSRKRCGSDRGEIAWGNRIATHRG